jgi:hypothetical protein
MYSHWYILIVKCLICTHRTFYNKQSPLCAFSRQFRSTASQLCQSLPDQKYYMVERNMFRIKGSVL